MFKRYFKFIFKLMAGFFSVSLFLVILFKFVNPPVTPLMVDRIADSILKNKEPRLDRSWEPLHQISKNLIKSAIASEDSRFFQHHGIDWKAVEEAREYNRRHKKKVRGASTITMQTARNVFLWHDVSYIRKALEVYFTYIIDFVWGKKRILEVYCNVAEWGDGIYGAEAAARKYFNKPAKKLTRRQGSLMAVVLPNPRRWNPARPTSYISKRSYTMMARMQAVRFPEDFWE